MQPNIRQYLSLHLAFLALIQVLHLTETDNIKYTRP
ncbi:Protein of unknown function [Pyronema omphalodes CBS 100304]|uniref:Uncharacterized protein n=1 Tax=Pyronema omphalodes (strain CBS 100304) TaxID=1076935 RepID=U4L346_PYROM|nr:Protein of unknown function [Pyronema omphalodes CBS 100304]